MNVPRIGGRRWTVVPKRAQHWVPSVDSGA